mmetsp:Transcript_15961/g.43496  ORF Transcript_15961/g.43496 Transcript_15961/m.43496 type:complete len:141 (+) Transcript_15961:2976-3398(+)|eukprot:CAMPEP_0202349892 /NCGR_PEP_ID=MMETSP1126-20121109/7188_1 /ASSEMBLY_ACC=CAM_ASM_000457 /TAXON_ID=3047 /ORGANISM="Dunaliella tertiolecta, Strain CCMP1320" /LENGTH=140 /DNA_ID=CAMNT_0048941765 /DNA_START=63 /DNA_END=485 /DNA_ORIENTATION=-
MSLTQKIQLAMAMLFLSGAAYLAADIQNTKANSVQIGVRFRPEVCERKAAPGDTVSVHYQGKLVDGTEFDNSFKRGRPIDFKLGQGVVIKGWEQGILGMCVGEKRLLKIPPALGYGDSGAPPKIPGKASLIFETELVDLK